MQPYLTEHWGNPSSSHTYGRQCKAAVDTARMQVAHLIGAHSDEIIFTSCGTESDNWAISGAVMAARQSWLAAQQVPAGEAGCGTPGPAMPLPHVVASAIEHVAVLAHLQALQQQGLATHTLVPVGPDGRVEVHDVLAALTPQTVLVTLMHSNNEVGTLQPVAAISAALRDRNPRVRLHSDAAQSVGKVAVRVDDLGVDLLTLVGHKLGAPKGVAALFVRRGTQLHTHLHGGGQEAGRRAGTESVLLLVGLGAAAEVAAREEAETTRHMRAMRDRLQAQLLAALPEGIVRVNGPSDDALRLPNTLSLSIAGFNAGAALSALSEQLAASAGSACHSGGGHSSPVLQAMQVPREYAAGTLRLSTGRHTTADEVDAAVRLLLQQARAQGLHVKEVTAAAV